MLCGGFGEVRNADSSIVELCNEIKSIAENHFGQTYTVWEPVHYRIQPVTGTSYLIKVKTDNDYVHVKVYKPLSQNGAALQLMKASSGHTLETPL
jgi:hypothetical protein